MAKIKRAAKLGGKKTASLYGKEYCEERAQKGGQACLARYGREFFRAIRLKGLEQRANG